MAEKIASADTITLRGAIGLNDRFMMIRDLFGGDAAAFDAAVSDLERFTSLEEALLYINDTYDWNPQSRAAGDARGTAGPQTLLASCPSFT